MIFNEKNILLISPEPWTHLFVSKHHYAVHLAQRGNAVFFLNPPSDSYRQTKTDTPNVFILDYPGFLIGMRYDPAFLRRWFTRKVYQKLERLAHVSFEVVWSFDNSVFYQMDALPKKVLKISHIVDLNQNFETKRAAITADINFCVTQRIKSRSEQYAPGKVHLIPHGVSVFEQKNTSQKLPGSNKVKVLYAGNLAMQYLDWEIIKKAVHSHPNIDFIFFGSHAKIVDPKTNLTHSHKAKVLTAPNTHFPGVLKGNELTMALAGADVLLICYQDAHHINQTNSHKIMEYLYSGKPVVATYTEDYVGKDLLYMCEKNVYWPALFEKTISDLSVYSTPELAAKRRAYALNNTYTKQIGRIENLIRKNVP